MSPPRPAVRSCLALPLQQELGWGDRSTGGTPRQPPTYVGLLAEEAEAVLVDGQDAGRGDGVVAAALDVEEGRAEHGAGAQQPCGPEDGGLSTRCHPLAPRGGSAEGPSWPRAWLQALDQEQDWTREQPRACPAAASLPTQHPPPRSTPRRAGVCLSQSPPGRAAGQRRSFVTAASPAAWHPR